mmetsp:Transcript_21772/g.64204  ORF Transcript_21772/g.64204 Transcript_21772/m.64204 type:complete len:312 (-) Transcript_21772:257-1192(-)
MYAPIIFVTNALAYAAALQRGLLNAAHFRAHQSHISMQSGHAPTFCLSMWYPNAEVDEPSVEWVSAYASHHVKLQQVEKELEQCELLLDHAIANEDFDEADGLQARVERIRSMHPIWSAEELLADAIVSGDFATAKRHHERLEDIRWNLGLPKFLVGQVVTNEQVDFRCVVMSVDTSCVMSDAWLGQAVERTHALKLERGRDQPWYTCIVDTRDDHFTPKELRVRQQNHYTTEPSAPVYLPEEALALNHDYASGFINPIVQALYDDATPHQAPHGMPVGLGLRFKPGNKLRLWQRMEAERMRNINKHRNIV